MNDFLGLGLVPVQRVGEAFELAVTEERLESWPSPGPPYCKTQDRGSPAGDALPASHLLSRHSPPPDPRHHSPLRPGQVLRGQGRHEQNSHFLSYYLYFPNTLQCPHYIELFSIIKLLGSSGSSEPDGPVVAGPGEEVDGLRLDPWAGGGTEAVVSLTIDVDPGTVHHGGAPPGPCRLAAVDPVGAGVMGHSVEGEGEDAGLTCGGAAGDHAAGGRGGSGGGGGGSRSRRG